MRITHWVPKCHKKTPLSAYVFVSMQRIVRLGGAVDDDMANLIVVSCADQRIVHFLPRSDLR